MASLAGRFGDLDLAEEMAQEAFVEAVRRWPTEGVPPNPGGWLTVIARNKALDRLRRESTRQARHEEAEMLTAPEDPGAPVTSVTDERLRLLFTCCHPALAPEAQVALTLRLLGGLTVPEVANAFLVPERTMAQRITRAKRKIAAANIPYRVPRDHELPGRLRGVLAVVYLVFTEGHLPGSGDDGIRDDLCAEAIRLGRVLRELMPDEPEVAGPARPHAAHRRASRRAGGCRGRARHARRTRTARSGTARRSPRATPSCGSACAATDPATTSCSRPSTRCTPTPHGRRHRLGARCSPSTTSCTP